MTVVIRPKRINVAKLDHLDTLVYLLTAFIIVVLGLISGSKFTLWILISLDLLKSFRD